MGIKHNYTATGTNDSGKQVSVNRWNEDHVISDSLPFPNVQSPAVPSVDNVSLFGKKIGGRMMMCQIGPSGLDTAFQPNLGGNKVALWMPPGGAATVPGVFGMNALTIVGTQTARTVAVTNLLTRMTRLGITSAATAAALLSARETFAKYTTGAGGVLGGFYVRVRFAVTDAATVAGARMFVGLNANAAAMTNVEVNTLVNVIGVCKLSTSDNLHLYSAGATAGAAIDLGSGYPATANGIVTGIPYELTMFSPVAGGVYYQVTRLDTGVSVSGQYSGVPNSNTLLTFNCMRTNNATALAVGLDLCGIYIETDY